MKKHMLLLVAFAIMLTGPKAASAALSSTTLTLTGASQANLFVTALGGAVTAYVPFEISGNIDLQIFSGLSETDLEPLSPRITFMGANIDLSDESLDLSLGFLGGVSAAISNAGINTLISNGEIPLTNTDPTNPYEYTFDPGAGSFTELGIDQGLFTYNGTGPVGGLLGTGTVDFSSDPVNATLDPVGQIGLVTQDIVAIGHPWVTIDIVLSAPITFSDSILTDPVDVDVDLSGVLVATGTYVAYIPEPSTVVLLGIALVVMIPLRRRIMNRRN